MDRKAYFDSYLDKDWPSLTFLEPYFLAPPGSEWFYDDGNDSAGLWIDGVDDSSHLPAGKGRVSVELMMWGHPVHGVLLIHRKAGGSTDEVHSSKGDLTRIREWVRSLHDDPLPIGLFIPFDRAWLAVKEFMETGGKLPTSIEWVRNRDLPDNTFPDP